MARHPRDFLQEELSERKSRNPSYSGRAFARDLGVSQSFVSLVLRGRRTISPRTARKIGQALGWLEMRVKGFVASAAAHSAPRGSKPVTGADGHGA